ncbi:unnamed protein product, partial [Mesorhabditis spiculigera]
MDGGDETGGDVYPYTTTASSMGSLLTVFLDYVPEQFYYFNRPQVEAAPDPFESQTEKTAEEHQKAAIKPANLKHSNNKKWKHRNRKILKHGISHKKTELQELSPLKHSQKNLKKWPEVPRAQASGL